MKTVLFTILTVYIIFAVIGAIAACVGIVRRNNELFISIHTADVIAAIARAFAWPVFFVWAFFDYVYNCEC